MDPTLPGSGLAPPEEEASSLRIRRPADGGEVGRVPVSSPEEVEAAVVEARRVQRDWGSLSPADRARRLTALRREVSRRMDEVAHQVVEETGKPEAEALAEVNVVLALLRYYERRAPRVLASRRASSGLLFWKRSRIYREPFGVVGVISPWNYPFVLSADPVFTALFAGNTVVLKPSEETPFTGRLVEDLCRGAGLPPGVVQVVQGGGRVGELLVGSGLDRLHFTGGSETGGRVMAVAAGTLVPVTLELGGKDAALVLEDADLDRAARGVTWGAFANSGQTCLATERIYVVDSVYDSFLSRFLREVRSLRAGSGGRIDIGPSTTPAQLARTEALIRDAVEQGARVRAGGERVDPASNVLRPTVLTQVPPGARIAREEAFGPVVTVHRVRDEEEGIRRVRETSHRLFSSVWTEDRERGEDVAAVLGGGGASVNDVLAHYAIPSLPMGGAGRSGFGRIRGEEGLLSFTRSRVVVVDRGLFRREPWWFPYSPFTSRMQRAVGHLRGTGGMGGWAWALKELFSRGGRT